MQLRKITYNIILFFFAAVAVSCAKDELEAPNETPNVRAIEEGSVQDAGNENKTRNHQYDVRNSGDLEINDDGDEEDEGRNPDKAN